MAEYYRISCALCTKTVRKNQKHLYCVSCKKWYHLRCTQLLVTDFELISHDDWYCSNCLAELFPFTNADDDIEFASSLFSYCHADKPHFNFIRSSDELKLINSTYIVNEDLDPDKNFVGANYKNVDYYLPEKFKQFVAANNINSENFSILHLNAQSLQNKLDTLDYFLSQLTLRFTIVVVTETWATEYNTSTLIIPGYNCCMKPRTGRRGGGVAIYVDQSIKYTVRDDLREYDCDEFEFLCVQLSLGNEKKNVVAVYRPPKTSLPHFVTNCAKLFQKLTSERHTLYIAGDFNIDLLKYDAHDETSNFLDVALEHYLYPTISKPTRFSRSTSTLIDNIFVSSLNEDYTAGLFISDLSDHLPIFFISSIKTQAKQMHEIVCTTSRTLTDSAIFQFREKLATTDWTHTDKTDDVNVAYGHFISKFDSLYNESFPLRTVKRKVYTNVSKPWITSGIMKSIKKKDKLYRVWLGCRSSDAENNYKKYKNKLTTILRSAKTSYYRNRFAEVKHDLRQTWNLIRKVINHNKSDKDNVKELKIGDTVVNDKQIIADKFNEYFAHVGQNLAKQIQPCDGSFADTITKNYTINCSMFVEPTNVFEVMNIVNDLQPNKAPGYDSYSPKVIKSVMHSIVQPLTDIFNMSFSSGIFPDRLKVARVTPIFKADDKQIVSNYRPVSVLPIFSKILERLMYNRLLNYLEVNALISDKQFGFRNNHSTYMALAKLVDRITSELEQRRHCVGIFIDLSKAFDTLDHGVLLSKLNLYGVRGVANAWFTSYLSNRTQFVQTENIRSTMLPISCGVPQGSILGPLLFILYINDVIHVCRLAETIMFADDTNLFFTDSNLTELNVNINNELELLSRWFKLNKLSLNVKKTNYMHFCTKKRTKSTESNLCINMEGVKIQEVNTTKFLGVVINNTLTWNDHIAMVRSKIAKNIGIITYIRSFVPLDVLLSLYHALVEPYLQYCNIIWGVQRSVALNGLYICQKRVIRIICGSSRRAHSIPLFKQMNILPVYCMNDLQTACFMFSSINSLLPKCFNDMFILNANIHTHFTRMNNALHQTQYRLNCSKFALRTHGPVLWNSLPPGLKSLPNLKIFRRHYKQHLISQL